MMIVMLIISIVMAFTAPMLTKKETADFTALANIKKDIEALKTAVSDLTTATSNGFNDVQTNLTGLDTRLDKLESSSDEDDESGCPDTMVKVNDLCVAKTDSSSGTHWSTANSICWGQGNRLPSNEELNMIYAYRNTIGGFCVNYSCNYYYWSATRSKDVYESDDGYYPGAWIQSFTTGGQGNGNLDNSDEGDTFRVRCVRSLH
jgi:hypothetical protein